jgi:HK97 gp10 family phage protein
MSNDQWKRLDAAFKRVIAYTTDAALDTLGEGARDMAQVMKSAAPKDSGDLADSIHVTAPGQSVPAGAKPYGKQVAGEHEYIITAGNQDVKYPHLVEFGTATQEAEPYFFPAYRLMQAQIKAKARRAGIAAAKKAWNE